MGFDTIESNLVTHTTTSNRNTVVAFTQAGNRGQAVLEGCGQSNWQHQLSWVATQLKLNYFCNSIWNHSNVLMYTSLWVAGSNFANQTYVTRSSGVKLGEEGAKNILDFFHFLWHFLIPRFH